MVMAGRNGRRYCTIWLVQADWTGGGTIGHFGPMERRGFRGGGVSKSAGLLPTDITSKYAVQSASCRDSAHLILSYLQVHRFVHVCIKSYITNLPLKLRFCNTASGRGPSCTLYSTNGTRAFALTLVAARGFDLLYQMRLSILWFQGAVCRKASRM